MAGKLTGKLIATYIAAYLILLTGWATRVMTGATAWSQVVTQQATLALALATVIWIGGCALHYITTGDPAPVQPATTIAAGTLDRLTLVLEQLSASLARLDMHQTPPPIPENTPKLIVTPTETP
jgi:hypothetical protein